MTPGFFLVVRFWVEADAEARLLAWLDGGHVAEVVGQPGFLWCRRLRLEPKDGLKGYAMIYGIESRAAFEAYDNNAQLKDKFARERAPFERHMRIERFAGEVDRGWE
jgi:heme-degrading monooxygenase HmoA